MTIGRGTQPLLNHGLAGKSYVGGKTETLTLCLSHILSSAVTLSGVSNSLLWIPGVFRAKFLLGTARISNEQPGRERKHLVQN